MNKIAKHTCFLLCFILFSITTAQAQDIDYAEWFWNTDPGQGKATPVSVNAKGEARLNTSMQDLKPGLNFLYFRVYANEKWSLCENQAIYRVGTESGYFQNKITKAEYYWDTDPGVGEGTALSVSEGENGDYFVVMEELSIANMEAGRHDLFVRVYSDDGFWSSVTQTPIWILERYSGIIERVEYFWNNDDPGEGKATSVPFITMDDNSVAITNFDASTAELSYGTNTLHIRALADGNWSFLHNEDICKNAEPSFSFYSGNTACEDEALFIMNTTQNIQPETTFSWDMDGDGDEDLTTADQMFTYTYTDAGVYNATLTVIHDGMCETSYSQEITVSSISNPSVSLYVDDASVCAGEEIMFTTRVYNVTGEPDYSWYVNDVALDGESNDTLFISSLQDDDQVKVKIITSNVCAASNEATSSVRTVTIYDMPEVTLSEIATVLQTDAPFVFSNGSPSGGVYYLNDEAVTFFAPMMNEIGDYTLRYDYTNSNGCSNSAETIIKLRDVLTSLDGEESKSFTITPNPIKQGESAFINYDASDYAADGLQVEIFNTLGERIQMFESNSQPIEIKNLPANGLYVIQISTSEKQIYIDKLLVL